MRSNQTIRKFVIITSFGTVLTFRKSTFIIAHHDPKLIPSDHSVVIFLEDSSDSAPPLLLIPQISQIGLPPKFDSLLDMNLAMPIGTLKSESLNRWRGNFALADGFLCAEPNGKVQTDRRHAGGWETFCIVEWHHFKSLQFISANTWHSYATNELIQNQDISFKPDFNFCIGQNEYLLVDLIESLDENAAIGNIIEPEFFKKYTVHRGGWKIESYLLFNPLIYFVVFGSEIEDQIRINLDSLRSLGQYTGTVLIIHDSSSVQKIIDDFAGNMKIETWNVKAVDRFEQLGLRYLVGKWSGAKRYMPLLYLDADVIFDLPITPILYEILLSDKISAQIEDFSPVADADAVGAALFSADRGVPHGHSHGFNSGIIGIPDIDRFGSVLYAVAITMLKFAKLAGHRGAPVHYDQPYANYVFLTLSAFDGVLLTKYVRYMDSSGKLNQNAPMGFVHFWGPRGRKHHEMQSYLDSLRSDYKEVAE